jgi:beta-glucanase (GH16 family)
MELIGRAPNTIYGSLHAPQFDVTDGYNGQGFSEAFHTYAANWFADRIEFEVDGHFFKTVRKADSRGHWPFEGEKFFIILNLAIGGRWPGNPDGSTRFP